MDLPACLSQKISDTFNVQTHKTCAKPALGFLVPQHYNNLVRYSTAIAMSMRVLLEAHADFRSQYRRTSTSGEHSLR